MGIVIGVNKEGGINTFIRLNINAPKNLVDTSLLEGCE